MPIKHLRAIEYIERVGGLSQDFVWGLVSNRNIGRL
jgi:hypothetical protein